MHNRIVIVENTRVQFSCKLIKILCLSVLSDDNTLVQKKKKKKICKYIEDIQMFGVNMTFI